MLIGIDASRALRTQRTGTERYAREIIRHLLQLPTALEHDWFLYTDQEQADAAFPRRTPGAKDDNVEWCYLPWRRMWTHRIMARELKRRRPDVFFVPSHVIPFTQPRRLPPSVVTVHDLGFRQYPEAHTRFQHIYLTWSTKWSTKIATRVIAVSRATAEGLQSYYGIPSRKIAIIHEAATPLPSPTSSAVDAVRIKYGLERPYALYVGTIQPRKNIARLIEAYAALTCRQELAWDLVITGNPGWLSGPIYDLANRTHSAGQVRFTGYVPDEELPALFVDACFFCYPSLFEGFGLPILEAQSFGVPVMTANNSSLPEVAGDAALLVDPTNVDEIADAMLRLSQDAGLRQELIAAGYENVKRFSWEKAAHETLAVLEEAARTGSR